MEEVRMIICSERTDHSVEFVYPVDAAPCKDATSGETGLCIYGNGKAGYVWDSEINAMVSFGGGPTVKSILLLYQLFSNAMSECN